MSRQSITKDDLTRARDIAASRKIRFEDMVRVPVDYKTSILVSQEIASNPLKLTELLQKRKERLSKQKKYQAAEFSNRQRKSKVSVKESKPKSKRKTI